MLEFINALLALEKKGYINKVLPELSEFVLKMDARYFGGNVL